jgi:transposase InsO family protein
LVKRDFTAPAANQRYVGDITYLPLSDGENLYLATVIDCYSRRIVGWAVADHMRTELVEDGLQAAQTIRGSLAGAMFHSDHGSTHEAGPLRRRAWPARDRGLSSSLGVFVRMVIGSSFERTSPSAGVAAGVGVHTLGWVVLVGPVVRR